MTDFNILQDAAAAIEVQLEIIRDEIQRLKHGAGERVFGGTLHPTEEKENTMTTTISDLQKDAHAMAKEKGFWDDADRNYHDVPIFQAFISQKLALIHSEVTEALDEVRDNRPGWIIRYAEDGKPEGIASELADVVIRTLDLADWLAIDLGQVIEEKMAYNKTRPNKHGKNF